MGEVELVGGDGETVISTYLERVIGKKEYRRLNDVVEVYCKERNKYVSKEIGSDFILTPDWVLQDIFTGAQKFEKYGLAKKYVIQEMRTMEEAIRIYRSLYQ